MRFRIVNGNLNNQKNEKQQQKDTQTRQSSASKFSKQNSFLQMVKNSYEFYMTIGKDKLKQQQMMIAKEKKQKLKKMIKKQRVYEQRRDKKQYQNAAIAKIRTHTEQKPKQKRPKEPIAEPTRKSQRSKHQISYNEALPPINEQQLFNVLNISSDQISHQSKQIIKLQQQQISKELQQQQKNQSILQKIQKVKQELIFQDQGTYQIGIAHQALLRVQKFIDQHLNFAHEIRQTRFIQLGNLIKYVKSHGFVTFDMGKFTLLTRINPYLYSFSDSESNGRNFLMTFKLNGLDIDKRLESTRRRMTQVSVPELFT